MKKLNFPLIIDSIKGTNDNIKMDFALFFVILVIVSGVNGCLVGSIIIKHTVGTSTKLSDFVKKIIILFFCTILGIISGSQLILAFIN